ncbi:MAG: PEP-CTERM sorting domain-containing protein, partial [Gammaproteobacteria bacterium]|nr:PEP-CTERM sorting domain-containing protein [Gammaproteobacteria bacterium]
TVVMDPDVGGTSVVSAIAEAGFDLGFLYITSFNDQGGCTIPEGDTLCGALGSGSVSESGMSGLFVSLADLDFFQTGADFLIDVDIEGSHDGVPRDDSGKQYNIAPLYENASFFYSGAFTVTYEYDPISSEVPEPITLVLIGLGLAGIGISRKIRFC